MFTLEQLSEIEEWCIYGLVEGEGLPHPRAYGLAYRRLYENMPVRAIPGAFLCPAEPFFRCKTGEGDAMNGGAAGDGLSASHHAHTYIVNPFHSSGLDLQTDILAEKKARYPQYADAFDALPGELEKYRFHRHGYIHSNPDTLWMLKHGFARKKAEIDESLAAARDERDAEGEQLLLALRDYAAGIDAHIEKVRIAARGAAASATGGAARKLYAVADALDHFFYQPAEHFLEGLLTINLLWMLDGCDSAGILDLALGELLEKDLESGAIDIAFARELLAEFFSRFERMNGWNIQLGGAYNRLTLEALSIDRQLHIRRPNLALRVSKDMPDEVWSEALKCIVAGTGKPALYNDELYRESLMRLMPNISPEDSKLLSFGGCTETMLGGLSCVDSLLSSINLAEILERTIYEKLDSCATFEEFIAALKQEIAKVTRERCLLWTREITENGMARDPNMARTMFTRDCVTNRRGFECGGARYNWATISYDGTTTLIDSLAAISQRVFIEKSVSAGELISALRDDFVGHERVRALLASSPKFGNDLAEADAIGAEVLRFAWEELIKYGVPRGTGGRFIPSVILFATYENAGRCVGATPDGRRAGAPLNDSMGAVAGRDTLGPTALMNSVLRQPLSLGVGTPVVNVRLSAQIANDESALNKVRSLVEGFFAAGGMQLQFTVLDTAKMRAAQACPENYRDLIVRIGGYSEYFVYLSPALQETVIARSEHL